MRSPIRLLPVLSLLATTLAWSTGASAQTFSADYELSPSRSGTKAAPITPDVLHPGALRLGLALPAQARFSGAGLSIMAGQNWFAQAAVGRSLAPGLDPAGVASHQAFSLVGGYSWSDGQTLSLQLTGGRRGDRLGLSASYDWPRYFVRLAYDEAGLKPVPQDRVRFSAGMRF